MLHPRSYGPIVLGCLCLALAGCGPDPQSPRSLLKINGQLVAEIASVQWSSPGSPDGGSTGPGTVRFEVVRVLPGGLEALLEDSIPSVKNGEIVTVDFDRRATGIREFFEAVVSETRLPECDAATREPDALDVTFAVSDSLEHVVDSGASAANESASIAQLDAEPKLEIITASIEVDGEGDPLVPLVDPTRISSEPTTYDMGYDPNQNPVVVASPGLTTVEVPASAVQGLTDWVSLCVTQGGCTETQQQISVGIHYRNAAGDEVLDAVLGSVTVDTIAEVVGSDPPLVRIGFRPGGILDTARLPCSRGCAGDAQCNIGEFCALDACRQRQTFCFNGAFSMNDRGDVHACLGYTCNAATGVCRTSASSSSDCSWGYLFDGDAGCVPTFTGCSVDEPFGDCEARRLGFEANRNSWYDANPYPVWKRSCEIACSSNAQCTSSEMCLGDRCVLKATYCGTAGTNEASIDPNTSTPTDCGVYACEPVSGFCNTSCVVSDDCLGGHPCDTATSTCT